MKILIVEDDAFKRDELIQFLQNKDIEFEIQEYVNPALRYIIANKEAISGIILDLGLQSAASINNRSLHRGLDVVNELRRKKINIPVLINSTTSVDMINAYSFVFGHRMDMYDNQLLEDFVSFLRRKEEQQ